MRFFMLLLLLIIARMPLENWQAADKDEVVDYIGEQYITRIDVRCAQAKIEVYDGKDGFVYFEVKCTKEKTDI